MKLRFFSAVSITAAAACAVFACSSNKDSGGTSGACQTYANAYVAYAEKCTGAFDPSQQGAIASRFTQLCTGELALPGAPDISAQLTTCAASLNNAACNVSVNQLDGCNAEVAGTLADGAACVSGEECKSGDCRFDTSNLGADGGVSQCGTCAAAIPDGADCGTNGGTCVQGDTCNFGAQADGGFSGTCTKKPAPGDVGATCSSSDDCKSPNHCVLGTNETGTCTAPIASGGACGQNVDCAAGLVCAGGQSAARTCGQPVAEGGDCGSDECAPGLACDFSSGKCKKITFGDVGAACDGVSTRCVRGECKVTATGGSGDPTGVCPTIIADGQPCDRQSPTTSCDEFANCSNGTCVLVPAACK